jgi:hypothetical protein
MGKQCSPPIRDGSPRAGVPPEPESLGVSVRWDERASGMRKRSAAGGAYAGPP